MHERGKSDGPVVPAKPPNKAAWRRGGGGGKGPGQGERGPAKHAPDAVPERGASSALDRVREVARRDKEARFTALLHHVDRRSSAGGVLGDQPEGRAGGGRGDVGGLRAGLEANLRDLHGRVHSGRYRARPSRRAYIPKADGRQRPLGIAVAGGQDRPAGGGRGAERRLRGGLPRLLLRVPAGAQPA